MKQETHNAQAPQGTVYIRNLISSSPEHGPMLRTRPEWQTTTAQFMLESLIGFQMTSQLSQEPTVFNGNGVREIVKTLIFAAI